MLHAALMTPTDVVIQLVADCEVFRAVFASIDEGSAEVNVFDMLPHIATIRANPSAYCTSVTSGAILQSTRVRHWRRAREHRSVAHKLGGILAAWGGDGDGGGGGGGERGGQLRGGGRDSPSTLWFVPNRSIRSSQKMFSQVAAANICDLQRSANRVVFSIGPK